MCVVTFGGECDFILIGVNKWGSEDSPAASLPADRGENKLVCEVHYSLKTNNAGPASSAKVKGNLSQSTNEMLDLFVSSADTPQMSHPAKHRLPISWAN